MQAADSNRAGSAAAQVKLALEGLRGLSTVGGVSGIGLLWGAEFVADKTTKSPFPPHKNFAAQVGAAALQRGLIVYPMQGCVDGISGDHLLLAPPATITGEQIGWAVERLADSVEEVTTSMHQ